MTLDQFLTDYSAYCVGAFALGWAFAKLLKFFQILMEKI